MHLQKEEISYQGKYNPFYCNLISSEFVLKLSCTYVCHVAKLQVETRTYIIDNDMAPSRK